MRLFKFSMAAVVVVLLLTAVCMAQEETLPTVPREFRGAWVATVANIDWPSQPGLRPQEQKEEAIAILDKLQELNMNAAVFQVRPQADALYKSELEPWSFYLTGEQGKAPDPLYDPLEFWVKEAHARGIELHTWYNPYRANHPAMKSAICEKSIVKAKPQLVAKLGDKGYYWMIPTMKEVQDHSVAVVMDVVKRYDIDGVHFDDYFYPYPSYNDNKDFPDDEAWKKYKESGGKLSRGDWRRNGVDTFISRLYTEIKKAKPHVKFGISPFGIWRPHHPESIRGLDQYDVLYADAKLWFNKGWVDYMTPQLYWPISQIPQSFPVLLGWWEKQNLKDHHLWPGMSIGRAGREGGVTEMINQIMVTKGMVPEAPGNILFSMKTLMGNRGGLCDEMLKGPYKAKALPTAYPWLDSEPPKAPEVKTKASENKLEISWEPKGEEKAFLWVVYTKTGDSWGYDIIPGAQKSVEIETGEKPVAKIAVSSVDRCGNESERKIIELQAAQ